MRFTDLLFAFAIVYLPYEAHYPLVLDVKGVNALNMIIVVLLVVILVRRERAPSPTPLKGRFLFFFAALTIAFLIGESYDSWTFADDLTVLKDMVMYASLYFIYYHGARDERSVRVLYAAVMLTLFLISLQGVRQAFDYGIASYNPNRRITGPFGGGAVFGANMAAGYFIIMLPMAMATLVMARSRPLLRLASAVCIGLGTFATFYTYSRQAYFALAALFLLIGVRRSAFFAIVLLLLGATFDQWAPDTVMQRIDQTEQVSSGGEEQLDASTESRFLLWQGGMELFSERPWGIGLNHWKRSIGPHVPAAYKGFDAHNGFVLLTTECGVLGIASFVFLIAGLWGLARRMEKLPDADSQLYGYAFGMAVLGLVCANLFGSRISNGEVMVDFWALAGIAARHYTMALARSREPAKAQAEAPGAPAPASMVEVDLHHAAGGSRRQ